MEGPTLIWYERQLQGLAGEGLLRAGGDRRQQAHPLIQAELGPPFAEGKLLYLPFQGRDELLRLHCLMFGDVRLNRTRPGKRLTLRLSLRSGDKLYVYLGAAKRILAQQRDPYLRHRDLCRDAFDATATWEEALAGLGREAPATDALLDQFHFPGLGNKIKNEAFFEARVHPAVTLGQLDDDGRGLELLEACRAYALRWIEVIFERGQDHVSPPTQTYRRKRCSRCATELKIAKLGRLQRKCCWCPSCQVQ